MTIFTDLKCTLSKNRSDRLAELVIAGHSLGAGLAMMLQADICQVKTKECHKNFKKAFDEAPEFKDFLRSSTCYGFAGMFAKVGEVPEALTTHLTSTVRNFIYRDDLVPRAYGALDVEAVMKSLGQQLSQKYRAMSKNEEYQAGECGRRLKAFEHRQDADEKINCFLDSSKWGDYTQMRRMLNEDPSLALKRRISSQKSALMQVVYNAVCCGKIDMQDVVALLECYPNVEEIRLAQKDVREALDKAKQVKQKGEDCSRRASAFATARPADQVSTLLGKISALADKYTEENRAFNIKTLLDDLKESSE